MHNHFYIIKKSNSQNSINANYSSEKRPTGSVGAVNNIYDMAGNMYDRTAEALSSMNRVLRGVGYGSTSGYWYTGGRDQDGPVLSEQYGHLHRVAFSIIYINI